MYSYIVEKFKLPVIPYKYETPNRKIPDDTADVIKYLNAASFDGYPFETAIKKYVEKPKSSSEINSVRKSLAETILIAPNMAVNNTA